jgi:putative ABC transport system permease protein
MFLNYLKFSIRNLASQKGYTLINISGLAVGIASALLILFYVIDEFSYDRFHPDAGNIYRICLDAKMQDTELRSPVSNAAIGPLAYSEYPDILNFTRIFTFAGEPGIRYQDRTFVEKNIIYADSSFFQVFRGFRIVRGDPGRVLNAAYQMVMTESTARKYFGNEDPIGKGVRMWNSEDWEVVAVAEDPPSNSHITFDTVCSLVTFDWVQSPAWDSNNNYTYLLLQEGLDRHEVDDRLTGLVHTHAGPLFESLMGVPMDELEATGNRYKYFTQPLQEIHLKSNMPYEIHRGGNITMVYVFMLIALFILVIAAINFVNLATARSSRRAKEIGMRKIAGSTRSGLIGQFLTESLLVTTISMVIAIVIILLAMPWFNNISGKTINLSSLPVTWAAGILLATLLIVGMAAGSYPAFFLAAIDPIKILRGKLQGGMRSSMLRGMLVVIQFSITIALLVSTIVVFHQISYIRNKDIGIQPENLIVINRPYVIPSRQRQAFDDELRNLPQVVAVSRSSSIPTTIIGSTLMQKKGAPANDRQAFNFFTAGFDFDRTLQFRMAEGRYFGRDYAGDSSAIVINQSAERNFGFDGSAVGQVVNLHLEEERTVVGVIEDFHYESLHHEVSPLVIAFQQSYNYLTVRIAEGSLQDVMPRIEAKWNEFVPDQAFDFFFLEDAIENIYRDEQRAGILFSGFSILAIIIASLGLLGLASYSAEQRTREIGVRKAFGANEPRMVWLLLMEINKLFIIATIISWPVSWYLMNGWLNDFAFRVNLSPWIFAGASLFSYVIALLTVSYQALRVARTNPATTLKYE